MKFPPDFFVREFHELLDNKPLLVVIVSALVWGLIQILLDAQVSNTEGVWVSLVYIVLIIGSLASFDYFFDDFSVDEKEKPRWLNLITYGVAGFTIVIVFSLILQTVNSKLTLWKVWELSTLSDTVTVSDPIVVHFFDIAHTLGITAKQLEDFMSNVFLISPGEELTFRGVVTFGIARLTSVGAKSQAWVGGILATGLWALIHAILAYTEPSLVVLWVLIAYMGGLVMLWAMVQSGDITAAILIHSLYNGSIVLMSALMQGRVDSSILTPIFSALLHII